MADLPGACTPDYWDGVAEEWARRGRQGLWRAHADAVNAALLERWLPPEPLGRVLKTDAFDEAVGEGLYPLLARRAREVVAADVSGAALALARDRYPALETVRADARALPFEAETFDAIVSNSTLDHFDARADIAAALRELGRVLRPGGTLVVTLDNLANPLVRVRNALPSRPLEALGVVPFRVGATCGPRGLGRLLDAAGLPVDELTAVLHCPRVVAVALAAGVGHWLGARGSAAYLRALGAFERLEALPTRYATGHFVAARARRP